jgi:hypothetical protein
LSIPGFSLFHEAFCLPYSPALPIEPGADRVDDTCQIVKQVFCVVFGWIDHFNRSALDFQKGLDIPETEAGE